MTVLINQYKLDIQKYVTEINNLKAIVEANKKTIEELRIQINKLNVTINELTIKLQKWDGHRCPEYKPTPFVPTVIDNTVVIQKEERNVHFEQEEREEYEIDDN